VFGSLFRNLFTGSRLGLQNAYEAAETLAAQRDAAARPLYQTAEQRTVNVTPAIRRTLTEEPAFRDAYTLAKHAADAEDRAGLGRGLPVPDLPDDLTTLATLPARALDGLKHALDTVIERAGQEGRPIIDRRMATALRTRLNAVLGDVDAQIPEYAQARAIWAGAERARDALALGKGGRRLFQGQEVTTPNFLQRPPEVVSQELAGLGTEAEREMYRLGAMQSLHDGIYSSTSEGVALMRRIFGAQPHGTIERSAAQRIRLLFPKTADGSAAAQDFMDQLRNEAVMALRGEELASAAGRREAPSLAVPATEVALGGRSMRIGAGVGLARAVVARSRTGWTENVSDEISNLFTRGLRDPNELELTLEMLTPYVHHERALLGALPRTAAVGVRAERERR